MAHDEELADRVRVAVHGLDGPDGPGLVEERRMFGGLAFLVDGHMALAASGGGGIMVRVDEADRDELLTHDHVGVVEMSGRPTRGWVRVDAEGLTDDGVLQAWVQRGVAVVREMNSG